VKGSPLPEVAHAEREMTPIALSKWLIKICKIIEDSKDDEGKLVDYGQLGLKYEL
jgi:hypothetical protein